MPSFIRLLQFSPKDRPKLFEQYLELKYVVFVAEQGWTTLADPSPSNRRRVQEESFDENGQLFLASTEAGEPIGVLRSIALTAGFPHRELLEHHLERPETRAMWARLGTMNALAVLAPYRRREFQAVDLGWTGSVARLLMLYAMRDMQRRGLGAALATTGGLASTRLCRSLGFQIINAASPVPHLHPGIEATNVGVVFGSPGHLRAQQACGAAAEPAPGPDVPALALLKYFEECEKAVLAQERSL